MHELIAPESGIGAASAQIGRRRFIQGIGAAAGTGAIASVLRAAEARAAVPAGASQFVPLPLAQRVIDTREPHLYSFIRHWDNHVTVPIAGSYGVPGDATAIVATVTAVNLVGPNWLTVVPTGSPVVELLAQNRLVSALNMTSFWEATANLVQVKLSGGGVDLFSLGPCEMILDILGYYKPVSGAVRPGRFIGLDGARRAIDTRQTVGFVDAGSSLVVDITNHVPDHASSAVINLTATECTGPGFFTAYPYDATSVPFASSLNVNGFGDTRAAAVIAPVATHTDGRRYIKIYSLTPAKLIVDVTGFFTNSKAELSEVGLFVPVDPVRILDTRDPGQIGRLWPGWYVEGGIPGPGAAGAAAVVVNLTGVDSRGPGYLTMSAARRPLPPTSNLNFTRPNQFVPNHVITPITEGFGYHVYSSGGAHVIVDYAGYYTGTPAAPLLPKPTNPDPPPVGPLWILRIPRIGVTSQVRAGNAAVVTDSGHSWHWTGTGFMGEAGAHVASFAHRTTHGGPYRYLHLLSGGDRFTLETMDGRLYVYEVVARYLTDFRTPNILDATRFVEGTTYSLIACSEPNFQPTNLSWRIVVTGVLVGWQQI